MTKNRLYLTIDLGTSFIKTGVYSMDGIVHAAAKKAVASETPSTGVFIQRGEELFSTVKACIKQTTEILGRHAAEVASIAFTGQMAGCIGVDENWDDITTWSCTLDSRYTTYAEAQRGRYSDLIFDISGTSSQVMSAKYDWFKHEFPEAHKHIAKYLLLNGYMIGKMAQIPIDEAKIDYSLVTWTGLVDIRKRQWSTDIASELDIDISMLPEITSCTEIGGYLHADVANELNLTPGIPLVLGAGDKVSGCIGSGVLQPGEFVYEAASYGAISCMVDQVKLDDKTRRYDVIGAIDNNGYYAHKYFQGSGVTLDWFTDHFYSEHQNNAFAAAEKEAEMVQPGSGKLLSIGLLGGGAMPFDSDLRGLFMGHTWSHNRGHFYRSLLESFAYELALSLRSIQSQYTDYKADSILMIGGGSQSVLWPQILADVTGATFNILTRDDTALWGAALLAAKAIGDIDDVTKISREHAHIKQRFIPNEKNHELYRGYVSLYEESLFELKGLFAKLKNLAN